MKTNAAGINLIKGFEGFRAIAYLCPANVWTIGYGHTGDVNQGDTMTRKRAEEVLARDLLRFESCVENAVTVPLNENEFAALVSFAYNIGCGALKKSTLLQKLNSGDRDGAASEFKKWNRAGGKILNGLVRRREAESELFTTPIENTPI